MEKLNNKKVGLVLGSFFALAHVLWFLLLAVSEQGMQAFINWLIRAHSLGIGVQVFTINWMNAVIIVIIAFAFAYAIGWIFSAIWNFINKK